MIKNQQFHRRTERTKLMNFCITHYVLYCSLFVISSPRAYPLPLEYLLPSVCPSNEALVKTAKNTKSYYCTTLTLSHHYLVWKLETLTSNDDILIVNDVIDAFSQINSSSLVKIPIPPHAFIFMFDAPSLTNAPTNRSPKGNYLGRILEQSDREENRSIN